MSDTTGTQNAQQPNFVAIPLEDFQGALTFINQSLPTGLGMPLLERLGRNIGLRIPPENLPPNFYPSQVDVPAGDGAQALADDLDKIADIVEAAPPSAKRRR